VDVRTWFRPDDDRRLYLVNQSLFIVVSDQPPYIRFGKTLLRGLVEGGIDEAD
jgi:hypothetical protein